MRNQPTRLRRLVRILILLGAALVWMGPPRPPVPPGCRGPRPPLPPHPFHEAVDKISPESRGAR
jgi:hypothetical protein